MWPGRPPPFEAQGRFDHLVYTAGEALLLGPLAALSPEQARAFFETRYWGALWAAKHAAAHIAAGGSITLTSGTVATRPAAGSSLPASVTGATEALTRALALELAPVRVNAVRPGAVRSGMWTGTVPDPETVYADFASRSPLARVAEPEDIAAAYVFLMTSSNTTGTILTCDGGAALV